MVSQHISPEDRFIAPVGNFFRNVCEKQGASAPGEPEEQLRGPLENLLREFSRLSNISLVLKGESQLESREGRPDYAVHDGKIPIGYIELKAPGKGADPERFTSHDKKQWGIFKNLPNILYSDGECWALYRNGERVGRLLRFDIDLAKGNYSSPSKEAAVALFGLLRDFIAWEPIIPSKTKELASFLAPYCRLLRDEVTEALRNAKSPIHRLKNELKTLLFPEASDEQFADAYAQTVLFALLLARMEGANTTELSDAIKQLGHDHLLLSRSLLFLTDTTVLSEIETALNMVNRVTAAIEPSSLKSTKENEEPWLFFYEHFLAAYDPELRKQVGAYYTPLEVVNCQVRLVHEILVKEFGKQAGFLEAGVITLDPAVGTGTYLLGVISHALAWARDVEGDGAVPGNARSLCANLHGFEWLVGPYAVAQLRVSQALTSKGATLPTDGIGVYLTNALESPHIVPPTPSLFHEPIAMEQERALQIKDKKPAIVILGNPPYGRHEKSTELNRASTGAWVRYGEIGQKPILDDFLAPAKKAGFGLHLKNLYNHYVYFIRWALWKTFEHKRAAHHGIVTFITASSYLDGDAFAGLRHHMRKVCERIDIIDLGGDGRGTGSEENVFDIQTPVCIFVAWRKTAKNLNSQIPAKVRYHKISGDRAAKLAALGGIQSENDIPWREAPDEWLAPFTPDGKGAFFTWPLLTNIMPWQSCGIQCSRTWPIGVSKSVLEDRWRSLFKAINRAEAFKEGRDLRISSQRASLFDTNKDLPTLESLNTSPKTEPIIRYGYRSFDRQYLLADARIITRPRPPLWVSHGDNQLYFVSLFSQSIAAGSALTCSAHMPDLDFFRGSYGAKAVFPLFRNSESTEPNIAEGLLGRLASRFKKRREELAIDIATYIYAILAHPGYTNTFNIELQNKEIRIPLTKDVELFNRVASFGRRLICLHTYGERFPDSKVITSGKAKCKKAVPDSPQEYPEEYRWEDGSLYVGNGVFAPVSLDVYNFEVSGLNIVQSWLGYRMKSPKGKKSSPLDSITPEYWTREFTSELLELLWLIEATIEGYPTQKALLDEVLSGPMYLEREIPPAANWERKRQRNSDNGDDDEIQLPEVRANQL